MNLPEFSVRHSILGNMMTIFVIVAGLIMVATMQRDTFPDIEVDVAMITTVYPNASAAEVEDLVTNPIEDEIRDVDDIEEYTSTSLEGISVVTVTVDPESRYKERVFADIRQKVDQVTNLPEEAEEPEVEVVSLRSPVLRVCVAGDVDEAVLRDYGDALRDRIKRIPDVSTVDRSGWRDEEFWVEVDLEAVRDQDLPLGLVAQSLARRNVNRPGGKMRLGGEEIVLRTLGQFHTAEEIERVVVRSNPDGNSVLVRDIATVRRTYEEDNTFTKVNGERCLILGVKKKRSGDTIKVADAVKALLVEEQDRAPEGVSLTYVDDESFYVKRRLTILSSNGLIGMVLVVAILFVFLNVRVAFVTGVGIPFAFLAALLLMSSFGITVNLITMFGLIIVLGMVVDDAIIVGENVFRHMEEGMDPRSAAIRGTSEVMFPVFSTVLTTVAAFLPLVFAPDTYGQVMRWFPIVVSITLAASLFEVLFIMPCHVADFVKPLPERKRKKESAREQRHGGIRGGYGRLIRRALRWRYLTLVLVVAVFGALGAVAKTKLRVDIFPADAIDGFIVYMAAEEGATLDRTEEIADEVTATIMALPEDELDTVLTYIGGDVALEGGYSARGTHRASTIVYLTPQNERDRRTQAIMDELRERTRSIPGLERLEFEMIEYGPPAGKPLEVRVRGDDFDTLLAISREVQAYLSGIAGVNDIQDDFEEGKDEIQVVVDEPEAARLGLSLEDVSRTVYTAFQGAESTIIREGNDEVVVRVRLQERYRNNPESLPLLEVPNATGRLVPLARVASFERREGRPSIMHFDGDRVVTVSATLDTEKVNSTELNRAIAEHFQDLPERYPGYELVQGGEWEETLKLTRFMYKAFGIALLLIYVILAVQFDSFMQPFVVMAAIPLGLIGVVLALLLHLKPVSLMAMMGMIGMTGVVVNDAIVLVKFVNDARRRDGKPVFDAIVEAGEKRFRPIMLTSVTTIAGLVPVIYGIGGYEPFVAPAAIALAYGLLFATVLTLVVVPTMYYCAYDVKRVLVRVLRWALRRPAPGG